MKRVMAIVIAIATLAFVSVMASGAQAGTTPKTTGSVGLSDPTQYMKFDAFESTPVKGSVSYTNFEYAVAGTGVWVPADFSMGFAVDPSPTIVATYAMTVTSFTPTSPTSVKFAGTGDSGVGWISTFTGTISGNSFTLSMIEINAGNPSETYTLSATGTITSTGAVAGSWYDNYGGGRTGNLAIADIGYEVFHYVAPVQSTSVTSPNATFSYVIPAGLPVPELTVTVSVHDGGSPGAGNDTLSITTIYGVGNYPIVSGNLTVFA